MNGGGQNHVGFAVVIQQGVLGGQPAFVFVIGRGALGGGQPGFEERGLAVFVEVGLEVGDGFRKISAETREVVFRSALAARIFFRSARARR